MTSAAIDPGTPTAEPEDWQARCGVQRVHANGYYSGVACLSMVAGISFTEARQVFVDIGLGVRRTGRAPFSNNLSEMRMAVASTGLLQQTRRWRGWDDFQGLGILKMRADWRGAPGKWYWATAFRHPEFDIAVFDPHSEFPSFRRMPMDALCVQFDVYQPRGEWLQIEQRFSLSK
jgi:hypothetical protein